MTNQSKQSKNGDNKSAGRRYLAAGCVLACVLAVLTAALFFRYQRIKQSLESSSDSAGDDYTAHYALIVDDSNDSFWTSVYSGALAEGKEEKVYVELMGENLPSEHTEEELLEMAMAEKVDGILIVNDSNRFMSEKIGEAVSAGIPVVTLLRDCSDSSRISYVGISYYALGQQYAEQILGAIDNLKKSRGEDADSFRVMLLMDDTSMDSSRTILYSTIKECIAREDPAGRITLETMQVDESTPFEAEEEIRNLFVNEEELPDICVSMDEITSACVYQEIVDCNEVGNVEQIAFGVDPTILSGIKKNIIYATAGIDSEEMGALGVKALTDYLTSGHVSDYYAVDTFIVGQSEIGGYMEEESADEQE